MEKNSYRDLRVWQESIALAKEIYVVTKNFPKEEQFGLTSQIRRSVVSIASNIAEGCARNSKGEFIQFLGIASGSLAELCTQLIIAKEINILSESNFSLLEQKSNAIGKMLSGLKESLRNPKPKLVASNPTNNQEQTTKN